MHADIRVWGAMNLLLYLSMAGSDTSIAGALERRIPYWEYVQYVEEIFLPPVAEHSTRIYLPLLLRSCIAAK